ncbi:MAG: trigger factor, partial [Nitrospirae bacterium]|nr:trigger factor [Nitrospirota bacterium]
INDYTKIAYLQWSMENKGDELLKTIEDITATKKRLTIEIPADALESQLKARIEDVRKKARLPGFRPGKAPLEIIVKKFGKEVEAETLEKIIPEYYLKAVKDAKITPVSQPVIEESSEFKRAEPFSITVNVEVRPDIEPLNYEGVTVKDIAVEVKEEEIERTLQHLLEEKAAYESSDEPIKLDDLITIDYTGTDIDTSAVEGGDAKEAVDAKDVVLKVGSGPYPEEFFKGLVGKGRGDECEIEAFFPADLASPFANKRMNFKIKITDIKKRSLPALDDEFAKDMGFDDIKQMKDKMSENLLAFKKNSAETAKQKEILDKLIESHAFEAPEGLVQSEIRGVIEEIRAAGKDSRTDEDIEEEVKHHAVKRVKATLLLELIGEKEGVTVAEDDMKQEVFRMAQRYYMSPDNIIKFYMARDGSLEGLRRIIFEKKVLNLLLSKAKTEDKGENS